MYKLGFRMGLSFGLCCFKRLRGMWSSVRGVVFHKDEVRITNVTLMAGLPLDSLLLSALVCSYARRAPENQCIQSRKTINPFLHSQSCNCLLPGGFRSIRPCQEDRNQKPAMLCLHNRNHDLESLRRTVVQPQEP